MTSKAQQFKNAMRVYAAELICSYVSKILNARFWKPTFIKANLRPKNVCLGQIRPKVTVAFMHV